MLLFYYLVPIFKQNRRKKIQFPYLAQSGVTTTNTWLILAPVNFFSQVKGLAGEKFWLAEQGEEFESSHHRRLVADTPEHRAEATRDLTVSELSRKADKYSAKPTADYTAQEAQAAREGVEVSLVNSFPFCSTTNLSAHVFSKI